MVVQMHGFDWSAYSERVMPAFERWFIQRDEGAVYELFKETRCAHEEAFVPPPLQLARVWPRAIAFAETLPLGPYSRREYEKLCSAEQFTLLNDRFVYKHLPRLYQNPEPIRAIWGAVIETYCLPWRQDEHKQLSRPVPEVSGSERVSFFSSSAQAERNEALSLLREAGLSDLARELGEQSIVSHENIPHAEFASQLPHPSSERDLIYNQTLDELLEGGDELDEYTQPISGGISIGTHPNPLQLRGWLARISVRAQALFEYLVCGRRVMPFGYEPREPYGVFIGYLTPREVQWLFTCLRDIKDPPQDEAETAYQRFLLQQSADPENCCLIDEILPLHMAAFHHALDMAAAQGLGLICSSE